MIVIPMAGVSRRFAEAGYTVPKYMLPLGGRSVFAHALESFRNYFSAQKFLFVARENQDTHAFISRECQNLSIENVSIVILEAQTAGQAETVELGIKEDHVKDQTPITIFNIDTFRPGFTFPADSWVAHSAGYLEVFYGTGDNWSYVRPHDGAPLEEGPLVSETAEKRVISNLCCSGLYHFARAEDFQRALALERRQPTTSELYVAPLYNFLIKEGLRVHYSLVDKTEVIFCGVPAEYEALVAREDACKSV